MFVDLAWAMGQPAAGAEGQQGLASFLPLIIIFGIFYFLLIRPQQQKQKKQKEMITNLKKGDKVITVGGIYGTIVAVGSDTFRIKIADEITINVRQQAVSYLQGEVIEED